MISNLTATLKNDMQITLEIAGTQFETYIKQIVNGQDGTDPLGETR